MNSYTCIYVYMYWLFLILTNLQTLLCTHAHTHAHTHTHTHTHTPQRSLMPTLWCPSQMLHWCSLLGRQWRKWQTLGSLGPRPPWLAQDSEMMPSSRYSVNFTLSHFNLSVCLQWVYMHVYTCSYIIICICCECERKESLFSVGVLNHLYTLYMFIQWSRHCKCFRDFTYNDVIVFECISSQMPEKTVERF